jgi:hypothetical protein
MMSFITTPPAVFRASGPIARVLLHVDETQVGSL